VIAALERFGGPWFGERQISTNIQGDAVLDIELVGEKLGKNHPDVLVTRGNWWRINSECFESDPAKAKAMMEQTEHLVRQSHRHPREGLPRPK
jgi:hypothetical protein